MSSTFTNATLSCAPVERDLLLAVPGALPPREVQEPVDDPGGEAPDKGRFDQECRTSVAAGVHGRRTVVGVREIRHGDGEDAGGLVRVHDTDRARLAPP